MIVQNQSMNKWQGRKRAEAAAATITIVVVVNNGPIVLPMILSTIKTYNTISFQIHRLMLNQNNQSSIQSKAKRQPNSLHFQLFVILNRFTHRFIYLDCCNLECIPDICLFTHIELFFNSINPNSNLVNVVSRIDR